MRRRDKNQFWRILARADRHALRVEWYRGDERAGGPQGDMGAAIAGAFNPGMIAALQQRAGDQREAGLRRRHDQDLAGLCLDAAMNRKMP